MSTTTKEATTSTIGMGTVFAMIVSWTTWHSFWWTIVHGFFGWVYVLYYAVVYGFGA